MKNSAVEKINNWYTGGSDMPLVVRGARGVGKTFAVLNFASECDRPYLYVNFETNGVARAIFEDESKSLEEAVSECFDIENEAIGRFLIIFDEYQACNRDLMCSEGLISASGAKIIYLSSFDVKAEYEAFTKIMMMPLGFTDFLDMTGKTWYREVIEAHYTKMKPVPALVHQEITDLFYEYLRVGGMPGVIKTYIDSELESDVIEAQMKAVNLIKIDIRNYGGSNANAMLQIVDSVPSHVAAGKPHFMPGMIRRGLTAANLKEGIDILMANGIICRLKRGLVRADEFRLELSDCGLLRALLMANTMLRGERLDREMTSAAISLGLCGKYDIRYLRMNGSALNALVFTDVAGENIAIDISGTYLRHSTVSASFDVMAMRPRIIRLNDDNFQCSPEETILPAYVYELL